MENDYPDIESCLIMKPDTSLCIAAEMSKRIRQSSFFLGNELQLRLPYNSDKYNTQILVISTTFKTASLAAVNSNALVIEWMSASNPRFARPPEEKYDVPAGT